MFDAKSDGCGKVVFCVAAAGDHEGAKGARSWVGVANGIGEEFGAEDGDGDGVVKDFGRVVEELVRGAAAGYSSGCHADAARLHTVQFKAAVRDGRRIRG